MIPPFERLGADRMTRHHLLHEKPDWEARTRSKEVRQMGAYVVGAVRAPHDYLHLAVKPVPVPSLQVLNVMRDLGREYEHWHSDEVRISQIVDELIGFAKFTTSPEICHQTLEVAVSIDAQMGVLGLMKGVRLRREEA